jgi:HlyD family type I secretion membrane fusion protein
MSIVSVAFPVVPPRASASPTVRSSVAVQPFIGRSIVGGVAAVVVFLGGFGWWAATAPLDSAAIAEGAVIVEGKRKTVQHLEGGIVTEIRVVEGARVAAGDVLVKLDDTQARSKLDALRVQSDELAARVDRLIVERDGAAAISFSADLLAREDEPQIAVLLSGQRRIFATRSESLHGQIDILEQRKVQIDAQIAGLRAQVASVDMQLRLIDEQIAAVDDLVRKGLERKPRLLELQGRAAALTGTRGEYMASIARAQQARGETQLQIFDLRNRRAEDVAKELRDVQGQLDALREQLRGAEDVLQRTTVVAPTDGVVMDLRVHTTGGVVGSGQPILDIVPANDNPLIEAKLRPLDIDAVRPGLPAKVRLSALKQRNAPELSGRVVHVAADSLTDQRTGQSYYVAHVTIPRDELARVGLEELYPGMQSEVFIVTGARTAFAYLVAPIRESFARAFREE